MSNIYIYTYIFNVYIYIYTRLFINLCQVPPQRAKVESADLPVQSQYQATKPALAAILRASSSVGTEQDVLQSFKRPPIFFLDSRNSISFFG